jgi:hypothetical protein
MEKRPTLRIFSFVLQVRFESPFRGYWKVTTRNEALDKLEFIQEGTNVCSLERLLSLREPISCVLLDGNVYLGVDATQLEIRPAASAKRYMTAVLRDAVYVRKSLFGHDRTFKRYIINDYVAPFKLVKLAVLDGSDEDEESLSVSEVERIYTEIKGNKQKKDAKTDFKKRNTTDKERVATETARRREVAERGKKNKARVESASSVLEGNLTNASPSGSRSG